MVSYQCTEITPCGCPPATLISQPWMEWASWCPPSWLTLKRCKYVQVREAPYLEVPLILFLRHSIRTVTYVISFQPLNHPYNETEALKRLSNVPKATQLEFQLRSSCAFSLCLSGFVLSLPYPPSHSRSLPQTPPPHLPISCYLVRTFTYF